MQKINGLIALKFLLTAYEELHNEVLGRSMFEYEMMQLMEIFCKENKLFAESDNIYNAENDNCSMIELGECNLSINGNDEIINKLKTIIPNVMKNEVISIPIKINPLKSFNFSVEVVNQPGLASRFVESIIVKMLNENKEKKFRCVDLVQGGNFFSLMHSLNMNFPFLSGGKIYKTTMEIEELLKELEGQSGINLAKIGISYDSIYEYNEKNKEKIESCLCVIYLSDSLNESVYNRIKNLMDNNQKNGISFILIGNRKINEMFNTYVDYSFVFDNDMVRLCSEEKIDFELKDVNVSEQIISELQEYYENKNSVDTSYKKFTNLQKKYFTMDSTKKVRIPFAVNERQEVQYFEIGGDAPSHALISGSTGSGKSVALHTLIMQIVQNYHPEDVEIWAIDYKAVEFDWYMKNLSPHFKVIAHDTSSEFSLSFLDFLYEEYERRTQEFLNSSVRNIEEFRRKNGEHSMPRIVVFIDEFQIMTQAVTTYTGNKDYKKVLENLMRLTRAMGISFVLCSQTIASGLSGLTDSAKDQIGCRLSLKHDDANEIRETLMLSGENISEIVSKAKNLRRGQGIYRRIKEKNNLLSEENLYEYDKCNIIYINDEVKEEIIFDVKELLKEEKIHKDVILVKGTARINVSEKVRHPISQFMQKGELLNSDCVNFYPAAPSSLDDSFQVTMDNMEGENLLIIGDNIEFHKSIILHTVCSLLMNSENYVVATFVDEKNTDRSNIVEMLNKVNSKKLTINIGIDKFLNTIRKLKKVQSNESKRIIYLWFGLEKVKNEMFLKEQEHAEVSGKEKSETEVDIKQLTKEMAELFAHLNIESTTVDMESLNEEELSYEDVRKIILKAFEMGPENDSYHLVLFNNNKMIKKCGLIELDKFEKRIGYKMSIDDAFELFRNGSISKDIDDNTVLYYENNKGIVKLHPYLLPTEEWFVKLNEHLN